MNTDELKASYVKYYQDCPVQKYAAMFIGRDEDTVIRWRKDDQAFADAVQRAKAEWVRKRVIAAKAEFALERLEKDVFNKDIEPPKPSVYEQHITNFNRDPNSPDAKQLVQETLDILMEKTKWKQPPKVEQPAIMGVVIK